MTDTRCRCRSRTVAECEGAFVRAPAQGGWVDLSAEKAKRRDGYGFIYVTCPWCAGDLPDVPRQQSPNGDTWTAWGGSDG